jgi:Uma2 family endonuclease
MQPSAYVGPEIAMKRSEALARIEALPEGQSGEFVAGELVVSLRPASPHAFAAKRLIGTLDRAFEQALDGPGGWWILGEPELHLGDDIVIPDLAGWRVTRMSSMPVTPAFTLAPDWICEVLSPSTVRFDRTAKLRAYAEAGVEWAWLVDPLARTIEVQRSAGGGWLVEELFIGDEAVRAPPFDAVPLELRRLWLG